MRIFVQWEKIELFCNFLIKLAKLMDILSEAKVSKVLNMNNLKQFCYNC